MAYKVKLDKRKHYTGKELAKLELRNYAYIYEHRAETLPTEQKTLFDISKFTEIARALGERDIEDYYFYLAHQIIVEWLGKYSNIMWGYARTFQTTIEVIDGDFSSADLLLRLSHTTSELSYMETKLSVVREAIEAYKSGNIEALQTGENSLLDVDEKLLAINNILSEFLEDKGLIDSLSTVAENAPKEAGEWGRTEDAGDRMEFIWEEANSALWSALDSYYQLKAYNYAVTVIAAKYDVEDLEAFCPAYLSDFEDDLTRLAAAAGRLEDLQGRLNSKDTETAVKKIARDYQGIDRYLKTNPYTEESIAEFMQLLDIDEGLPAFHGGILMEALYVDPLNFLKSENAEE